MKIFDQLRINYVACLHFHSLAFTLQNNKCFTILCKIVDILEIHVLNLHFTLTANKYMHNHYTNFL